jgi:hypothetical protein
VGNFVQSSGRQSLSALQQSEPDIHNLAHVAETGMNSQDTGNDHEQGSRGRVRTVPLYELRRWLGRPCARPNWQEQPPGETLTGVQWRTSG